MYCRKEMVKILKCYLIPKKSYDTLSKGAIFFGQPCINITTFSFILPHMALSKCSTKTFEFYTIFFKATKNKKMKLTNFKEYLCFIK